MGGDSAATVAALDGDCSISPSVQITTASAKNQAASANATNPYDRPEPVSHARLP